jgi:hypothetical protein
MELLRRVDQFFNTGFVGKFGRLDKERTGLFREEMEKASKALRDGGKEKSNAHVESKQSPQITMSAKGTKSSTSAKGSTGTTLPEDRILRRALCMLIAPRHGAIASLQAVQNCQAAQNLRIAQDLRTTQITVLFNRRRVRSIATALGAQTVEDEFEGLKVSA